MLSVEGVAPTRSRWRSLVDGLAAASNSQERSLANEGEDVMARAATVFGWSLKIGTDLY
jgi:hypothetical protein